MINNLTKQNKQLDNQLKNYKKLAEEQKKEAKELRKKLEPKKFNDVTMEFWTTAVNDVLELYGEYAYKVGENNG